MPNFKLVLEFNNFKQYSISCLALRLSSPHAKILPDLKIKIAEK